MLKSKPSVTSSSSSDASVNSFENFLTPAYRYSIIKKFLLILQAINSQVDQTSLEPIARKYENSVYSRTCSTSRTVEAYHDQIAEIIMSLSNHLAASIKGSLSNRITDKKREENIEKFIQFIRLQAHTSNEIDLKDRATTQEALIYYLITNQQQYDKQVNYALESLRSQVSASLVISSSSSSVTSSTANVNAITQEDRDKYTQSIVNALKLLSNSPTQEEHRLVSMATTYEGSVFARSSSRTEYCQEIEAKLASLRTNPPQNSRRKSTAQPTTSQSAVRTSTTIYSSSSQHSFYAPPIKQEKKEPPAKRLCTNLPSEQTSTTPSATNLTS